MSVESSGIYSNFLGIQLKVYLLIGTSLAALAYIQYLRSPVTTLWCIITGERSERSSY